MLIYHKNFRLFRSEKSELLLMQLSNEMHDDYYALWYKYPEDGNSRSSIWYGQTDSSMVVVGSDVQRYSTGTYNFPLPLCNSVESNCIKHIGSDDDINSGLLNIAIPKILSTIDNESTGESISVVRNESAIKYEFSDFGITLIKMNRYVGFILDYISGSFEDIEVPEPDSDTSFIIKSYNFANAMPHKINLPTDGLPITLSTPGNPSVRFDLYKTIMSKVGDMYNDRI